MRGGGERPAASGRRPDRGARFAFITLGCPKNEADSDRLEAVLTAAGHRSAPPAVADLLIVNTCGFIDAAKEESIAALLDVSEAASATGARVAAYGCLVARHRDELAAELPEVDVFSAFDVEPLLEALDELGGGEGREAAARPRRRARPLHAYLKVSDGCDSACSFCAIPLIKGPYEAVPPAAVLERAGAALASGARELVLVGQDTSRWSFPGYGGIGRLLDDLEALGPLWLRLMYLQPENVSESLLEALSAHAVPYVDIPLQHASRRVLRAMRRRGDADAYLTMLAAVREALPGVALRTTFLVGFPGETESEFEELLAFAAAARPAVGGVFVFDPQEGTAAAAMPGRVVATVAAERAARLQELLDECASSYWEGFVGRDVEVLIERGTRGAGGEAVGRISRQAPDTDGVTYVRGVACRRGRVLRARVDAVVGFDLMAHA